MLLMTCTSVGARAQGQNKYQSSENPAHEQGFRGYTIMNGAGYGQPQSFCAWEGSRNACTLNSWRSGKGQDSHNLPPSQPDRAGWPEMVVIT